MTATVPVSFTKPSHKKSKDIAFGDPIIRSSKNVMQILSSMYVPNGVDIKLASHNLKLDFSYASDERVGRKVNLGKFSLNLGKHTDKIISIAVHHPDEATIEEDLKALKKHLRKDIGAHNPSVKKHYSLIAEFIEDIQELAISEIKAIFRRTAPNG